MKSALSLTLIVSLVGSTIPLTAQERIVDSTSGPIALAIAREAVRLAIDPQVSSASIDWTRVRKLSPGTELAVSVKGPGESTPALRHVVLADETTLTVLNLTDLPPAASRVLLDTASTHPERITATENRASFVDRNVRVAPEGIFVDDRKVADLDQVVERIRRTDLVQLLTGPFRTDWSAVRRIVAGTEVVLTVRGSEPGKRYFMRGTESALTVVDLTNTTLPDSTRTVLQDTVATHPESFDNAREGGTFLLANNVRLTRDGIFVSDRHIADLGQLVADVARQRVIEIRSHGAQAQHMSGAAKGALVGAAIGGGLGLAASAAGSGCTGYCGILVPAIVGVFAGVGALIGLGSGDKTHDEIQDIIYRVP